MAIHSDDMLYDVCWLILWHGYYPLLLCVSFVHRSPGFCWLWTQQLALTLISLAAMRARVVHTARVAGALRREVCLGVPMRKGYGYASKAR